MFSFLDCVSLSCFRSLTPDGIGPLLAGLCCQKDRHGEQAPFSTFRFRLFRYSSIRPKGKNQTKSESSGKKEIALATRSLQCIRQHF
jgi:hypothetical protein